MYENHKRRCVRKNHEPRENTRVKIDTRVFVEQHDIDIWVVINHEVNQETCELPYRQLHIHLAIFMRSSLKVGLPSRESNNEK